MKINTSATADVLKAFIQEDRTETRIYRGRVQNMSCTLAAASFAISAFLIGKVPHMGADQLRDVTLLIDLGLVAVMLIFFRVIQPDLVRLRKAMKLRQNLLKGLKEGEMKEIDPFADPEKEEVKVKPDISDSDLYWVVGLSAVVVLIKMSVLAINAGSFVGAKGTP